MTTNGKRVFVFFDAIFVIFALLGFVLRPYNLQQTWSNLEQRLHRARNKRVWAAVAGSSTEDRECHRPAIGWWAESGRPCGCHGRLFLETNDQFRKVVIRELKQRRWQRQRHKKIGLMSKNNRSARAFYIFVHFFAVLCKTTTWNDQIQGFVENVNTRPRLIFIFFLNLNATLACEQALLGVGAGGGKEERACNGVSGIWMPPPILPAAPCCPSCQNLANQCKPEAIANVNKH